MPTPPDPARIKALLPAGGDVTLTALPGDAGNRRYFRVFQGNATFILMQMADPEGFKASEEATTGTVASDEIPFLNIQRHLERAGLPVPRVTGTAMEHGLILLEDLGDTSLMAAIQADPARAEGLYGAAIDHLVALQRAKLDGDCLATRRAYSAELFMWEFGHYLEYGVEALHGKKIPAATGAALRERLSGIARGLGALPTVPVHRDYHSRNIMVRPDGKLGIIDFQDALMGPATYDLASLLWDPYVTLPTGLADRLAARYADAALPPVGPLRADFGRLLALTALQRLLKAAGRFVYIDRVKGNPNFLADVPACLNRAARILAGDPALAPLRELFAALEPRLGAG
ncbi:MAG: phosphotransferase [Nitrospirae bacterium]|nr:phosphotransferase [Nitrospirota bacterium]